MMRHVMTYVCQRCRSQNDFDPVDTAQRIETMYCGKCQSDVEHVYWNTNYRSPVKAFQRSPAGGKTHKDGQQ